MANTDLVQTHPVRSAPIPQQEDFHAGSFVPLLKPHFMSNIYATAEANAAGAAGAAGPGAAPPPQPSVPAPAPAPASAPPPPASSRESPPHLNSPPAVNDRALPTVALEQYRLQLYNYALNIERLRCPQYGQAASSAGGVGPAALPPWLHPYSTHCVGIGGAAVSNRLATLSTISLFPQSQRIFQPEEPKPQHSYIGLIAMAILSSAEMKLVLSDIYQYILDNYPYFRTRGPGWRNSIRHNLSLNDCFIKSGRSANGKGHYWAIHPANMDDFRKGDFRRRKAQRKVRRHMGLSVDDASTDSPSPPPLDLTTPPPAPPLPPSATAQASVQLAALNYPYHQHYIGQFFGRSPACTMPPYPSGLPRHQLHLQPERRLEPAVGGYELSQQLQLHQSQQQQQQQQLLQQQQQHSHQLQQSQPHQSSHQHQHQHIAYINSTTTTTIANLYSQTRKRQFDVASLLAPDVQIVDIVEDEDSSTQHTVITKVQVKKQQLIHRELIHQREATRSPPSTDIDVDADIDVDGDVEADGDPDAYADADADVDADADADADADGDAYGAGAGGNHCAGTDAGPGGGSGGGGTLSGSQLKHPRQRETRSQRLHSTDDNNSYLSDARKCAFEPDMEEQLPHNYSVSVSVSPPLGSSAATSSSQHDSNSLEECLPPSTTFSTLNLPRAYVELNGVDPHILSRYYGTYMAAAARRASLEASRVAHKPKAVTTPPSIEL